MGVGRVAAKGLIPVGRRLAPQFTSGYVREVLDRAIDGAGPFKSAAAVADAQVVQAGGDVEAAVKDLILAHDRMAGVQGFLTNIGGLVTLPVAIPANVTGLALVECRMVAGIMHLRGYDLEDPRVRNAVLMCLLGEDTVKSLLKKKKLPSAPMAIATSPVHDPELDGLIARLVTSELLGKVGGRRAALTIARRVPLLGGGVAAMTDAMATHQIGRYTAREMRDRRPLAGRRSDSA